MTMKYQISRAGKIIGAFNSEDIAAGIKSGSLVPGDHYWHEGMTDWIPLSELLAEQRKVRLQSIIKSTLIAVGVIILAASAAFGFSKYGEKLESERIAAEEESKARVSAKIQSIKTRIQSINMELEKCETFLKDFEIVGKGSPDNFDKKAPVDPGYYISKEYPNASLTDNFDEDRLMKGDGVPRFELYADVTAKGEMRPYIRYATKQKIKPGKYDYSGLGITCQISIDGEVREIPNLHPSDNDNERDPPKVYIGTFDLPYAQLTSLTEMLRAKKTPKVMLRAFSSTADITLKADRFLKYVELADMLKRQKDLARELDTQTDDMRRFSRPGAQDQTQGR